MENTIDGQPVRIEYKRDGKLYTYTFTFTFNKTVADFVIYLDRLDKKWKKISYIYLYYIKNDCRGEDNRGDGCKLLCFALKYFIEKYDTTPETKVKLEAVPGCAIELTKRTILPNQEKLESFYSKFGFQKEVDNLFVGTIGTLLEKCSNPTICQRKTAGRRRKSVVNKKRRRTRRN